jgi:hypothetical protein
MDEGDAKRDKGDLKGALKSYQAADAIMNVPTTTIEVARTQAALGLLLESRETLSKILRSPAKPGEPPAFANARKAAETLNTELTTRIPSVTVVVQNADPGSPAQITFDGEPVPAAAAQAPRKVNPGRHNVLARSGSNEKSEDFNVAEKETKTVTIDLAKKIVAPPPIADEPEVSTPSKPGSGWRIVMWSGFAVGAVGVGVGSVTGIMAFSKTSDVEGTCPTPKSCPRDQQSNLDSALSVGTVSTIAFIVGGAGIGVGVLGLVMSNKSGGDPTPPSSAATARVRVRPEVGPTWMGLSGSF